jgi:1-acyl-sn-glycerol-3-phosphate acyltransferase
MNTGRTRWATIRRRSVSLPALLIATLAITASIPLWLPIALVVDTVRLRFRFPIARLLAFGVCWSWIETAGVVRATGLWLGARSNDHAAHYELMGWWSGALMRAMGATLGVRPRIEHLDDLVDGNAVILARHASLGDSLLSGWALATEARVRPRFVLKRELLCDPCLDIVGLRVPNHFLDRSATDSAAELDALEHLAAGIGPGVVGVIFAEGTRSNDAKRARALSRIAERDPARADRLAGLRHLLPPRPAGSMAMLAGAPGADVILVWHTGFDGLDTFGGVIRHLARPLPPVRFVTRRVPRVEVPAADDFVEWLDGEWLRMDREVAAALSVEPTKG